MVLYSFPYHSWGQTMLDRMQAFQEEMNRAFGPSFRDYPLLNVYREQDRTIVAAEIPGIRSEDLEISIHEETLVLKGFRPDELEGEGRQVHRRERPFGNFSRTLRLPFRIDPDRVNASCSNGVVRIELQRHPADLPRRIEVRGQ